MARFRHALRSRRGRYDGRTTRANWSDDRLHRGNRDRNGDDDQAGPHGSVVGLAPDDKGVSLVVGGLWPFSPRPMRVRSFFSCDIAEMQ